MRLDGWLRLASHLGLPLSECMARVSHREYLVWQEWLRLDLDRPGRVEHYLMQIALEVRRQWMKNPRRAKLEHMRLDFGTAPRAKPPSREAAAAWSKARWLGMVGMAVEHRTVSRAEAGLD